MGRDGMPNGQSNVATESLRRCACASAVRLCTALTSRRNACERVSSRIEWNGMEWDRMGWNATQWRCSAMEFTRKSIPD